MFEIVECPNCKIKRKNELYVIGKWMQLFYESLVHHEIEAVNTFIFGKYPNVVLVRSEYENYTVEGFDMNVPYIMGGCLHRLFKTYDKIDSKLWYEQRSIPLPCVLCSFEDDCLAFREMPSTFYLKSHQYFCPSLIAIDNRRPHVTNNKVRFSYKSTMYTEDEIPELKAYECRLNHLGNMAFYPSGVLFPKLLDKLFLNSLPSGKNLKRRAKDLQTCINMGGVERAILPQTTRHKFTYVSHHQNRVKEVQSKGYSSGAKRYKDFIPNDFQCLTAPFECYKIVTRVDNVNEFRTLDSSEFGFLDPSFTSDGANVGKTLSIALKTIISYGSLKGSFLIRLFEMAAANLFHPSRPSVVLIVNGGEEIRRYNMFLGSVIDLRLVMKRCLGLVEVLGFGTPNVQLLLINYLPFIPYSYYDGLFFTPSEVTPDQNHFVMGLVMLVVPFCNYNHAPKNAYVSAAMRQVAQFYPPQRLPYLAPSHMWSLMYPQTIFLNDDVFPLYAINVMSSVMCVYGYNQEDAIVLNKSAVDRGLFLTHRYGNYKAITDDPRARMVLDVDPGSKLRVGDVLARITCEGSVKSYNVEIAIRKCGRVHEVSWNEDKISPFLHSISVDENSTLRIVVRSLHEISVGDKLVSCTGQKGVVAAIIPEEDLPFIVSKEFEGVPNLFLHVNLIKRQTGSLFFEGVNRRSKRVPFPHLDYSFESTDAVALLKWGRDRFTGKAYNGVYGTVFRDRASLYELSYQILPQHCSIEKCYGTTELSLEARDQLTGQLRRGKSHFGAGGFSSMDVDAFLGHGSTNVLREFMFSRADDNVVTSDNNDPVRIGSSMVRYMDDLRLLKLGLNVEIQPKVVMVDETEDEPRAKRRSRET